MGQTINGAIVGSVSDPTGAVIVGANVVAKNTDTGNGNSQLCNESRRETTCPN
jgi:hypothetical protein